MGARPAASVRPLQSTLPAQSWTATRASATGVAVSSAVTQTSDAAWPHLKCTPRFVTRAAAGTYIGCGLPSKAAPEPRARQLDHVEAGAGERDPDDFHRLGAVRLGQAECDGRPRAIRAREHRLVALRGAHAAQPRQDVGDAARRDAEDPALHPLDPVLRRARHVQHLRQDLGLEVAHRDGQRRIGIGLDDAEARGELGERREGLHLDGLREARGIDGLSARVVGQVRRHFEAQLRLLGKRPREAQRVRPRRVGRIEARRPLPAVGADEHDAARLLHGDGRREPDADRRDGDAAGILVLALAVDAHGEGIAHLEVQRLVLVGGDAGLRGHPLAPHEDDSRAIGEALHGLDHQHGPARRLGEARLQDRRALLSGEHAKAHALGNPLHGEPHVAPQRLVRGLGVECQHEGLLLVDPLAALARDRAADRGSAGREGEVARPGQRLAAERGQARAQPERAADPRGQIALEVIDPLARVHPAALAQHGTGDVEGIGGGRVPEGHHGLGEGRARLPHLLDGALLRKARDLGGRRGTREHERTEKGREEGKDAVRRVIAHEIGSLHEAQPGRKQFGPTRGRAHLVYRVGDTAP